MEGINLRLNFAEIEEKALPHFKGGEKELNARMIVDKNNKILLGRLVPGASVGEHRHEKSSEIIYGLSGRGHIFCDGEKELLIPGVACYCPEGSVHTVINDGTEDLTFFAVVPEHDSMK